MIRPRARHTGYRCSGRDRRTFAGVVRHAKLAGHARKILILEGKKKHPVSGKEAECRGILFSISVAGGCNAKLARSTTCLRQVR